MFMIYDQACRERYAEAPAPINRGLFMKPGVNAPYILSGATLEELTHAIEHRLDEIAGRTGDYRLDANFVANLRESITRFNGFAQTGKDLDFHRGESPYQIAAHGEPRNPGAVPNVTMRSMAGTGPYYAIMFCAGTLDTKGGPKTNTAGEVLDVDEKPIRGLYGAGNCVASPAGQAYWSGGATLGLALVFGALAGKSAATAPVTQATEA
jgi:succinate dehydrogenase/fumarate reductase flavoprotein subunit